jgi:CubicO group peptidase (beta-lactamase class C family)
MTSSSLPDLHSDLPSEHHAERHSESLSDPHAEKIARLQAVGADWNRGDAPGLIASVVQHGVPLLRRGLGLASLEAMLANHAGTRMRIGSTTKHFASVLALLMARDGLLDLDDPIGRWLPELPASQGRRTLRQLMNHTGGTRDALDLSLMSNAAAAMPPEGSLDYQCRQRDDNFAPGERFCYNNGGYRMLSIAIERILGKPFGQALRDWLFTPLGLHDTELWENDLQLRRGVAQTHVLRSGGQFERGVFPGTILGEGGIISTLDDMQRWLAHLQAPTLWDADLTSALLAPTLLNNGYVSPYGLGLIEERWRGLRVIHHAGGVVGGSCQMIAVPDHGLQVIVMSNRNDIAAPDVAFRLIEAALGDTLEPAPSPVSAQGREHLLGHFHCEANGEHVELMAIDGHLAVKLFGMPLPLVAGDGDELAVNLLSVISLRLAPRSVDANGRLTALTLKEQGWSHHYVRIDPAEADPAAALSAFSGRWYSTELGAEIVIDAAPADDPAGAFALMRMQGLYGRASYRLLPLVDGGAIAQNMNGEVPMHGVLRRLGGDLFFSTMRTQQLRLCAGAA